MILVRNKFPHAYKPMIEIVQIDTMGANIRYCNKIRTQNSFLPINELHIPMNELIPLDTMRGNTVNHSQWYIYK